MRHTVTPTMTRAVKHDDAPAWQRLRAELWPATTDDEHAREVEHFFWSPDRDQACLVAVVKDVIVGFIELSIHGSAEGCSTERVGYVEGWYVSPEWRRRGVGSTLMAAGEVWARSRGAQEFASDTELENVGSQGAHAALGFAEAARLVCFYKPLAPPPAAAFVPD